MVKCVFCGKEEREYKGLHLMKNDGSIAYYCSAKCRKNSIKLGRDKRKVRWTESFHITRQKGIDKKKELEEKAKSTESSEGKVEVKRVKKKKQ